MDKTTTFSSRSNAKRAAEKMLAGGTAPSVDYGIKETDDGRFAIAWKTVATSTGEVEHEQTPRLGSSWKRDEECWGMPPEKVAALFRNGPEQVEAELTAASSAADNVKMQNCSCSSPMGYHTPTCASRQPAEETAATGDTEPAAHRGADTRESLGAANDAAESEEAPTAAPPAPASAVAAEGPSAEPDPALIAIEDERLIAELDRRGYRTTLKLARQRRTQRPATGEPRRSKAAQMDEAAARGVMPSKPDVTSHANHHYQKRFDKLAELAGAGDWDAVAGYQCTGINSYAKMVRQYRDRLVNAHNAQRTTTAVE
jgi:hypothetical protein